MAIDLASGGYLADGAVLFDDGEMVLGDRASLEPALARPPRCRPLAGATAGAGHPLGHAFGNQHVPVDVEDGVVRIPLTTSQAIARATVEALGLDGAAGGGGRRRSRGAWRRCPWARPRHGDEGSSDPGSLLRGASTRGRRAADRPLRAFRRLGGVAARARSERAPGELAELVQAAVCQSVAPLDGAVLAHAQRATSIAELSGLDDCLSARKLTPSARHASQTCGRQLAALAPQLAPSSELVAELSERVRAGETDGNLAVVQARWRGPSGSRRWTRCWSSCAAPRPGCCPPRCAWARSRRCAAQVILAELAPALAAAAQSAVELRLDELSATAPELELAALAHARADARMFAT